MTDLTLQTPCRMQSLEQAARDGLDAEVSMVKCLDVSQQDSTVAGCCVASQSAPNLNHARTPNPTGAGAPNHQCARAASLEQAAHDGLDVEALEVDVGLAAADKHDRRAARVHHRQRCAHLHARAQEPFGSITPVVGAQSPGVPLLGTTAANCRGCGTTSTSS